MRKYFIGILGLFLLGVSSCKKEDPNAVNLEELIENKDVQGIKAYRDNMVKEYDALGRELASVKGALDSLDPNTSIKVSIYVPNDSIFVSYLETPGAVVAANDVNVHPESQGILDLRVREGQSVGRGQLLGTVDDNGAYERLSQAKVQVENAKIGVKQAQVGVNQAQVGVNQAQVDANLKKTTYQKQAKLWQQKIGSELQFLQAKAAYEASQQGVSAAKENVNAARKGVQIAREQVRIAERGVAELQQALKNLQIRAPFSGVVEEIYTKEGQLASPQSPVLRLVGVSSVKVEAKLAESNITKVRVGSPVLVEIPAVQRKVQSRISRVSSSVSPESRTFTVEVPVLSAGGVVKPNLNAQLKITEYTNKNAIVVPKSYIGKDASGKPFVYAVDVSKKSDKADGMVKKRYVTVGRTYEGKVEVLHGLNRGEEIIAEGFDKVVEGDRVIIDKG